MSFLSAIYKFSPVWFQNIGISLYGYYWNKRRFGGIFKKELQGFKEREFYTKEQWKEYQTKKLRQLLLHAYDTVPFYTEKYSKAGFIRHDFEKFTLEDIKRLPFLTKDELRHFGTTILLSTQCEPKGKFYSSSGSTGTPTQILFSPAMHQRWSAGFEARIRHWAGVDRFHRRGMIGGRRILPDFKGKAPYYRYNFFEKQIYMSAYHITSNTVANYLEGIQKYRIQYMTGYAKSNFFLARFLQEKGIKVKGVKAVITSSEKLTPEMRKTFEAVYGCKTYDSYSGVEACGLISETEYGQLLVSPDMGIMEIIDKNGHDVSPGETGEIISTGLLNFDQPLIRYKIGDLAELSRDQTTKCGRAMPVISEIIGRVEDVVIGKDGREIVRFHGIFINLPNLIATQIIQHTLLDITIKIVSDNPLSQSDEKTISERMESQLGKINLTLERVPELPLTKNGKIQAVISHVKRNSKSEYL